MKKYKIRHLRQDIERVKRGGGVTGWKVTIEGSTFVNATSKDKAIEQLADVLVNFTRLLGQHSHPDLVNSQIKAERG